MENFIIVNIRDEKELKKYQKDCCLKQIDILPYYREGYVCFSYKENYSFNDLTKMFLQDNDNEQIGAISIIAERYPYELYRFIRDNRDCFPLQKLRFILDFVVPSYLPLIIPKEQLLCYEFSKEYSNDIWVNILSEIRTLLLK